MKHYHKLILICLQIIFCNSIFGQIFYITNKNEILEIKIKRDSIEVIIENKSKKTIYLPKENTLNEICSDTNDLMTINFGVDIKTFNEYDKFQLIKLIPNEKKIFKIKINNHCQSKKVHFTYEFYTNNNKEIREYIYNTDITSKKNWLKKGNWEWGEITIITRTD